VKSAAGRFFFVRFWNTVRAMRSRLAPFLAAFSASCLLLGASTAYAADDKDKDKDDSGGYSPLKFGLGVLGSFGGNFLNKPDDRTVTVPGFGTATDTEYPGFAGTTGGFGLMVDARLIGFLGLEIDAIKMTNSGTADIDITTNGRTQTFSVEISNDTWHIPVLAKVVIPLPLLAPFAVAGPEFVRVGGSSATVSPAGLPVASHADHYTMWTGGLGVEVKLPLPGLDIRIPVSLRGSYNPSITDKVSDRVNYTFAGNAITARDFDARWRYQALGVVGAAIYF
jgi:hypothetical protein